MSGAAAGEAVARARAFVEAHGDEAARAYCAAITDPQARAAAVERIGPIDTPERALAALARLQAIGIMRGAAVERAVETLSAAQRDDGSWPLAGDAATVAATVAGHLAKTAFVRPKVLRAAGALLAAAWDPDRVQNGDVAAIAAWAQFFANVDHELSDAGLQWCGRELERGFRSGTILPLDVARVLVACDAQGLPGAQLGAEEIVLSLVASQQRDGGFGSPADPVATRVEATLGALAALRRLAPRAVA